jgi:hypothetical protein
MGIRADLKACAEAIAVHQKYRLSPWSHAADAVIA